MCIHTAHKKKILILGGTQFVGKLCAEEAVARGHEVTLLNRGTSEAPKGVTAVKGDRLKEGGYSGLDGQTFDSVIDTWFTDAAAVKSAVDALKGRISHYVYISTLAVYDMDTATLPMDESTKLFTPETADDKYSKDKIEGEIYAAQSGVPTCFPRPGIILGPHEEMGGGRARLPWWLRRMAHGGPTLVPGPEDGGALQFIDCRDLASFVIDSVETERNGAFNMVGKLHHITMSQFLKAIREVTGNKSELKWLEPEKMLAAGVKPFNELPLWAPDENGKSTPIYETDVSKAIAAGLQPRPFRDTIADTWEWLKKSGMPMENKPYGGLGIEPAKEAKILEEYFGA